MPAQPRSERTTGPLAAGAPTAEFLAKLGVVEEEADESAYWLELLHDSGLVKAPRLTALMTECDEITAIIVAAIRTGKRNSR